MAKELGLGPAIFLMSTKALTLLFLVLTIINVPVYAFFYEANDGEVQTPQDYFSKLSLGNLGQSERTCSAMNYATDKQLHLSCLSSFEKMSKIDYIGISKSDESNCYNLLKDENQNKTRDFFLE